MAPMTVIVSRLPLVSVAIGAAVQILGPGLSHNFRRMVVQLHASLIHIPNGMRLTLKIKFLE
jgi:hypothetical protein